MDRTREEVAASLATSHADAEAAVGRPGRRGRERPAPSDAPEAPEPKPRSAAFKLTPEEAQRVRTAVRKVANARGGFVALAVAMGVSTSIVYHAANPKRRPSLASRSRERERARLRAPVETTDPAALAAYAAELRPVVALLRQLPEDATAPADKRVHSRRPRRCRPAGEGGGTG